MISVNNELNKHFHRSGLKRSEFESEINSLHVDWPSSLLKDFGK